jgi:hypothetical protein
MEMADFAFHEYPVLGNIPTAVCNAPWIRSCCNWLGSNSDMLQGETTGRRRGTAIGFAPRGNAEVCRYPDRKTPEKTTRGGPSSDFFDHSRREPRLEHRKKSSEIICKFETIGFAHAFCITVDKWDRILLRSGSQDSRYQWTLLRNHLMCGLFRAQGQPAPAGDFALLFLNGANWGIYNPLEYLDDRFMFYNLGITEGDMVRTDGYATAREGDIIQWLSFYHFFTATSPAGEDEYAQYQARMDIDNFTLYWMFQIAAGNEDWPANNMDWVRERSETAKWRWILYDVDISQAMVQGVANDVLQWSLRDTLRPDLRKDFPEQLWTTHLLRRLLENQGYRKRFVQRFAHLLSTTFAPEAMLPLVQAAKRRIENSIPLEVEAWKHVFPFHSVSLWQSNITLLENYWTQRAGVLRGQLRDQFELPEPVAVHVAAPAGGRGHISIEGTPIAAEASWTGYYFPGFPLEIQAVPAREHVFGGWVGDALAGNPATLTWTPDGPTTLQALFIGKPIPVAPNDVIFNEYWIADDRTPYESIEGRSIEGGWIELLVVNPDGVDLRGWRITNNQTIEKNDPEDMEEGSLIFPRLDALAHLPPASLVLIIPEINMHNTSQFPHDELDPATGRIVLYAGNGNTMQPAAPPNPGRARCWVLPTFTLK